MNESELLFSEILACDRLSLYQNRDLILDKDKTLLISSVLKRRISGEPIQYILGKTEFLGLEFKVNRDVFIPRPETEILAETAINLAASRQPPAVSEKILDLGTGSGCIAVSLAKFINNAEITAIDISNKALEVALMNARLNNVNINFVQGSLFDTYDWRHTTYDLIISNPPYIAASIIKNLEPEIGYEPALALDGGSDGLCFYRKIISESPNYLNKRGFLIMEMGFEQRKPIEDIFKKSANFKILEIVKDYNSIDRVIVAQLRT